MIGQLRGRLADKRPNQVLVDVGGVGYLVQVPLSTFASLGELHTEVTLLIHTHVREDALPLYGFLSARENGRRETRQDGGAARLEDALRAPLQSLSAPKGRSTRVGA